MPMRVVIFLLTLAAFARAAAVDRVMRRFDFEERAAGNLEDVPMHWQKVEGPGLPHYVNGGLTNAEAHAGQYAFGFTLNGGSLVYRYPAGRIAVRPATHYRVGVMAKTKDATLARAQMTSYFADAAGRPIRASVVRSRPYAGEEWQLVEIDLTAPDTAASLVLELALLQPSRWRSGASEPTAIDAQDIDARAWFDDLTVAQVPKLRARTNAVGNVFRRGEAAVIDIDIEDRLTDDLSGRLDVTNADGRTVYQRTGDLALTRSGASSTARVPLPPLPAGWYRATLAFDSLGRDVAVQAVDFVQLPDNAVSLNSDARLGVIATDLSFAEWNELPGLLSLLGASRVKIGVWTRDGDAETAGGAFDRLIERLRAAGVTPTGCFVAPPPAIAKALGGDDLARLAAAPAEAWRPQLSAMVARYAGHVDGWQFCSDERATDVASREALRRAYAAVRGPMTELVGPAGVVLPWPVYADPPQQAASALALAVSTDVLPQHVPLYAGEAKAASLSLEFLRSADYGRATQVRDLAQRIGFAVSTDARRIDLPLPFTPDAAGRRQPADTYLAVRTLLLALSGATYQGRMPLGEDVEALLFDKAGEGVLLTWTKSPQASPKAVTVMLGNAPRTIDLDGNVSPVLKPKATDGTTEIAIGATPSLIVGIDGPLARLRSSFAFDNAMLESAYAPHVRRLTFTNPYPTPITGRLRMVGPAGWTVTPQSPAFTLAPGEKYDGVVTVAFPFSSVAGTKPIDVAVQFDSGPAFGVPMTMRLGLSDLGVETSAFRDGGGVVVQQMVTNYGNTPADYTAYASCPGTARQERLIRGLTKGQTVIKRYRFENVPVGKGVVRSGVRETQGTRALSDEIPIP